MPYVQLKAKLIAAMNAYTPLTDLIGSPASAWDTQLPQFPQPPNLFPAIVLFQVSNPPTYIVTGRMSTSFARIQFTIYGTGNDSTNADAVAQALYSFLDNFNAAGIANAPANPSTVVMDRDAGIAQTQPLTYQRIIDASIFNNDLTS